MLIISLNWFSGYNHNQLFSLFSFFSHHFSLFFLPSPFHFGMSCFPCCIMLRVILKKWFPYRHHQLIPPRVLLPSFLVSRGNQSCLISVFLPSQIWLSLMHISLSLISWLLFCFSQFYIKKPFIYEIILLLIHFSFHSLNITIPEAANQIIVMICMNVFDFHFHLIISHDTSSRHRDEWRWSKDLGKGSNMSVKHEKSNITKEYTWLLRHATWTDRKLIRLHVSNTKRWKEIATNEQHHHDDYD